MAVELALAILVVRDDRRLTGASGNRNRRTSFSTRPGFTDRQVTAAVPEENVFERHARPLSDAFDCLDILRKHGATGGFKAGEAIGPYPRAQRTKPGNRLEELAQPTARLASQTDADLVRIAGNGNLGQIHGVRSSPLLLSLRSLSQ